MGCVMASIDRIIEAVDAIHDDQSDEAYDNDFRAKVAFELLRLFWEHVPASERLGVMASSSALVMEWKRMIDAGAV